MRDVKREGNKRMKDECNETRHSLPSTLIIFPPSFPSLGRLWLPSGTERGGKLGQGAGLFRGYFLPVGRVEKERNN